MSKNAKRYSKEKQNHERGFNPKFEEEREAKASPIVAKTENQKILLHHLQTKPMVVASGRAGSGKSFLCVSHASNKLLKGEVDTIYLTRPYVSLGKSPGFYPGSVEEKMRPFLQNTLNIIKERIGVGNFENKLRLGQIQILPMETLRGMSFKKSILIIEEAQNTTPEEIRCITTRMEEDSYLYLTGDELQSDIRGENGIQFLKSLKSRFSLDEVGLVEFQVEDIVRSGLTKKFCMIYDELGLKQ